MSILFRVLLLCFVALGCKPKVDAVSVAMTRTLSAATSPEDAIARYLRENGSEDMIEAALATREQYISMEAGEYANSGIALTDSEDRLVFAICAKAQLSLLVMGGGGGGCLDLTEPLKHFYIMRVNTRGLSTQLATASVGLLHFQQGERQQRYNELFPFFLPLGGFTPPLPARLQKSLGSVKIGSLTKILKGVQSLGKMKGAGVAKMLLPMVSPVFVQKGMGAALDLLVMTSEQHGPAVFVGAGLKVGLPVGVDFAETDLLITTVNR
jgi:hypothetical protein